MLPVFFGATKQLHGSCGLGFRAWCLGFRVHGVGSTGNPKPSCKGSIVDSVGQTPNLGLNGLFIGYL